MILFRSFAASGLLLSMFVSPPPDVSVATKPGTEFDKYQSYDWIEGVPAAEKLSHQRITSAVENELAIKGLWRDDQKPDLHLSYYASTKDEVTIDSPYRTGWYDDGTIRVRRIHEGTVVLDMVDAKEDELVWRGIVTEALTDNARKNDRQINDTIRRLLDGFPPR